jgi:uncharacterized membrane protein
VGMITGLLTLPLAPVRGVVWVAELLADEAQRQLEEQESPQRALAELEAAYAAGEISNEDFDAAESELIDMILRAEGH